MNTAGMVDLPGATGAPNTIAVRTITQAGGIVWAGGIFDEMDDANGNKVLTASGLAAFDASTGAPITSGVHIPLVTNSVTGAPEVYGTSLGANGILYFTGDFDAVDGQPRHNVAAIDAQTGALQPFAPNGAAVGSSILATPDAIYVGTGKLLSYQLSGTATPGFAPPQATIDAGIPRGHVTIPAFRSIVEQGNTLVTACQCDGISDVNGPHDTKAIVEIDATTGDWNGWAPQDPNMSVDAWGIDAIIHGFPGTNNPAIYLAAGGSDFAEAFDFSSGKSLWKTDCSGSCQSVTWYQGNVIFGGHFEWTVNPSMPPPYQCGNNEKPVTTCYYTPKLVAMNSSTGTVLLTSSGAPWNPGICCRYEGVWAAVTGNDGSTLYVGGEFDEAGGTWTCQQFVASCLSGKVLPLQLQRNFAIFGGPAAASQTLTVTTAGAGSGTVTDTSLAIDCGLSCTNDFPTDQSVTLTAAWDSSTSTFTGWSSSDPSTLTGQHCLDVTGTCTVSMTQARSVTATFAPISYPLTVTNVSGTPPGSGAVTSQPPGISCTTPSTGACSSFFVQGTTVILTATPGANAALTGWGGADGAACGTATTCQVTLDVARNVTATFSGTKQSLTLMKQSLQGGGAGTVTSTPTGISCAGACASQTYTKFGTPSVTLQESAPGGSAFNGWSTDTDYSCPLATTCTVPMNIPRTVVADFEPAKKLAVTLTGGGAVTSTPFGLDCPTAVCSTGFVSGSTVVLTATPDATSAFTGWGGDGSGCGTATTCQVTMSAQRNVTANFVPGQTLTVTPVGTGSGTIITLPSSAIDCGLSCQANFVTGTTVTLKAMADPDSSSFGGWGGDGSTCGAAMTCQVTLNTAQSVTATFMPLPRTLDVSVLGNGTVMNASGIDCAAGNTGTCNATYDDGSNVELDVTPDANWAFTGWGNACDASGSDPSCVVAMNGNQTVTATFAPIPRTVNVTFDGSGTGAVTSTPGGIGCSDGVDAATETNCSASFTQGSQVVLHPVADPGFVFNGWGGDCTGLSDCMITIDAAKNVVADFEPQYMLVVSSPGPGSVTSTDGAIDCPGVTCTTTYAAGQTVTLVANAANGAVFDHWSGTSCSGTTDPTCVVMMDSAETVSASFAPAQTLNVTITGNGTGSVASTPARINCTSGNMLGALQSQLHRDPQGHRRPELDVHRLDRWTL